MVLIKVESSAALHNKDRGRGHPILLLCSSCINILISQVSSDMSSLDLDVPSSLGHLVSTIADLLVTTAVMASVTWPVLIVSIPAVMAAIYAQVNSIYCCCHCLNYLFSTMTVMF